MNDDGGRTNDQGRKLAGRGPGMASAEAPFILRPSSLVIIDYGVGNLRSVYKALEAAGAPAQVITSPDDLAGAAGIVLPGVGAFGDAVMNLRAAGFERPLLDAVAAGIPLLGICVGMQMLFDESEEMGRHAGLGVMPGRVVRFAADLTSQPPAQNMTHQVKNSVSQSGFEASAGFLGQREQPAKASSPEDDLNINRRSLKVPQIGWNQLCHAQTDPLLAGVSDGAYAYFVHSYYCAPADPHCIVATTDFGGPYASIVRRGNIWGIQCHPEKSQAVGLRILRNFVDIVNEKASTP